MLYMDLVIKRKENHILTTMKWEESRKMVLTSFLLDIFVVFAKFLVLWTNELNLFQITDYILNKKIRSYPLKDGVLSMTVKFIWWWVYSSVVMWNYSFIV